MRRVRHKKRGTEYEVLGTADLQTATDLVDGSEMMVYRGEDGRLWVRPVDEFEDGRFEDVPPPPVDPDWRPGYACDQCSAWDDCYDREGCQLRIMPWFDGRIWPTYWRGSCEAKRPCPTEENCRKARMCRKSLLVAEIERMDRMVAAEEAP